jgi:C4-type Zn-finger protein
MEKEKMTFEEYVAYGGGICPKCRGEEIESTLLFVEIPIATQTNECQICGHKWNDVYTIVESL